MNNSFQNYIVADVENASENILEQIIIQPVWYRGYFDQVDKSAQIKELLKYYKAKKIVVGHTAVNHISFLQGNYVIGIGTHFGTQGKLAEGLLIENKRITTRNENGVEIMLK